MRASKKVKGAVLLTAGAALFLGAPTVYAAGAGGGDGGAGGDAGSSGNVTSSNNGGLLSGLQLLNNSSVNVPATVCGVGAILALGSGTCDAAAGGSNGGDGGSGGGAVAATGGSTHHSSGGSSAEGGDGARGGNGGSKGNVTSTGNGGILSGLQVGNNLDLNVPVTACGVGALLARGKGDCDVTSGGQNGGGGGDGGRAVAASGKGKGSSSAEGGNGGRGGNAGSKGNVTSANNPGILSGAQVLNNSDLNVPITLCGVALLAASAGCDSDVSAGGLNGGGGGDGGGALALGGRRGSSSAEGGNGGRGGNAGSTGNVTSANNGGILSGLQLLNNASVNVPVTVCGLALLGAAGCEVEVSAGGANGGDGGNGGRAISVGATRHWDDDSGFGKHRDWEASVVRSAHRLPHTGAAGLALIPFGMALVAGGFALRRRSPGVDA
jgi:hypothetical protein